MYVNEMRLNIGKRQNIVSQGPTYECWGLNVVIWEVLVSTCWAEVTAELAVDESMLEKAPYHVEWLEPTE